MEMNVATAVFQVAVFSFPIPFNYGIFTHIWLIFMANVVGKYTIHGPYEFLKLARFGDSFKGGSFLGEKTSPLQ